MSTYNPLNPPLFTSGQVSQVVGRQLYPHDDDTGMFGIGVYSTFEITVNSIEAQSIGVRNTRSGVNKEYTGLDVKAGDWVVNTGGQFCLKIDQIYEKTDTSVRFLARDVDMVVYKTYGTNVVGGSDRLAFFELSDNGQPMITTENIDFFVSPAASNKVEGRFSAVEETERYRLEFETPQTGFNTGEIVTIDTTTGDLVRQSSANASVVPVGLVLEKSMGDTVVYIKPFNTIIDTHPRPELLTGSAGEIYWSDPSNPGNMTTTQAEGSVGLFLQIRDAIATRVEVTESDYLPGANDSFVLNGYVVKGETDPTFATLGDMIDAINAVSETYLVSASTNQEFAFAISGSSTLGDPMVVVSQDTGATYDPFQFQISDGTTTSTITLDDPANMPVAVTLIAFPTAANYLTYPASEIAKVINYYATQDGLNLVASTEAGGGNNPESYPNLRVDAIDGTSSIIFTNITTVQSGIPGSFTDTVGMAASTDPQELNYLVLERADGGDILIQGVGTYVNVNGLTSSSNGDPAVLLMLEGVGDSASGSTVEGIGTEVDLDQTPAPTSGDGSATAVFITYTPWQDSIVQVRVNGIDVNLGNGSKTKACYFSHDGGINARLIKDIQAGDQLYWNASVAGYELDASDDVDVVYEAASDDL